MQYKRPFRKGSGTLSIPKLFSPHKNLGVLIGSRVLSGSLRVKSDLNMVDQKIVERAIEEATLELGVQAIKQKQRDAILSYVSGSVTSLIKLLPLRSFRYFIAF